MKIGLGKTGQRHENYFVIQGKQQHTWKNIKDCIIRICVTECSKRNMSNKER